MERDAATAPDSTGRRAAIDDGPVGPGSLGSVTNQERLREFHRIVDGYVPDGPRIPDPATLALRRALVEEEAAEVREAFDRLLAAPTDDHLVALARELADLLYVVYGTFVVAGIDADAVVEEVHAANLRKRSGPRRADGKQLKPDGWSPPDVRRVVFGDRAR
ncbi:MAG TPA: hypothetical protein ENK55_07415 [Actinobacteria bacterium]|nr:hypothetical protein [Actinomycetota bacterium]